MNNIICLHFIRILFSIKYKLFLHYKKTAILIKKFRSFTLYNFQKENNDYFCYCCFNSHIPSYFSCFKLTEDKEQIKIVENRIFPSILVFFLDDKVMMVEVDKKYCGAFLTLF